MSRLMNLALRLAITAASLWVAVWMVPGLDFEGGTWQDWLLVTVLIVAVNAIVKPLLNILSIPFILITFGLFLLVTNALTLQLVIWMSDNWFNLGLTSTGFFWATFLGATVISVVRLALTKLLD